MRDKLNLYWMAFNTALQAKLEYRVDFVLGVITSCMLQLASLGFLWVILRQIPELSGWAKWEILALFGMTASALGCSELFFNNIWMLPYYIVQGELDRLLIYPVDSLYFLLVTRPELHAFGNLVTGLLLTGADLIHFQAPWYVWLLAPFLILLGCVLYAGALVIVASLSFKFMGPTSLHLMIPHALLQAT